MDWFTAWCWMVGCVLILCAMFIHIPFRSCREGGEEIKAPAGCVPSVRMVCLITGLILAALGAVRMWLRT